jgi:hypothetical protein
MKKIKKYQEFTNEEINWKKGIATATIGASLMGGMTSCSKEDIKPNTEQIISTTHTMKIQSSENLLGHNHMGFYKITRDGIESETISFNGLIDLEAKTGDILKIWFMSVSISTADMSNPYQVNLYKDGVLFKTITHEFNQGEPMAQFVMEVKI